MQGTKPFSLSAIEPLKVDKTSAKADEMYLCTLVSAVCPVSRP